MSIFHNVKILTMENAKLALWLFGVYIMTLLTVGMYCVFGSTSLDLTTFWYTVKNIPLIFGTLTYVVLGISLSYLTYKSLAKIICFTAVVTDTGNVRLINQLLINLFLLNLMASTMIGGHIFSYFWGFSTSAEHVVSILLSSLIVPITVSMRILEGCIDKLVNLEITVENNCFKSW